MINIKSLYFLVLAVFLSACGGGGGSSGANPNDGPLRTSAGTAILIGPGEARSFDITGGVEPYTVSNADTSIARGNISGRQLTVQAVGLGSTTVSVVDRSGAKVDIAVSIGSSTPLSVTAPSTLALALGPTEAKTYDVRGGVAPYVAVSSDPRTVGVSFNPSTLKLTVTGLTQGGSTVTVRDAANAIVSFAVTTGAAQALSTTAPDSLVLAISSVQTYKIVGGVKPYQVNSSNTAVVVAIKQFEDDLVVSGVSGGTANIEIIDITGKVIARSVTVGSVNALFTTAPASLTLGASETSTSFVISGGSAPYSVTSANANVARVNFSGSGFSVTSGSVTGSTTVAITDSVGARISLAVTVAFAGGGSTPSEPPATIEVLSSDNTMQSAGTGVTITAFVKNRLNVAMANEPVVISSDSGLLQNASTTTDTNGVATAQLLVGADKTNRTIRVTVRSGTASGFVNVSVVGTRVILTGDAAVQQGSTATYSVRVLDSSGNAIPSALVSLTSSRNNTLSPNPASTDVLGLANVTYTAVNATTLGNPDVLTANALGATARLEVVVSNVVFRFIVPPAAGSNVVLGATQPLTVEYLVGGAPAAGNVNFTTTRGLINGAPSATVALDAGQAAVNLSSGTSGPGPVTVLAQIAGVGQASLQLNFVADTPASVAVQANPAAIPPNSGGSTLSQSTIEATVRDAANNPVAGRQVNFRITSDLSGGSLSSPSSLTDLNGKAQVQYISGTTSTAVNGVTVEARVDGTSIARTTSLTVNSQALFITIGFGNTIENADPTTYSKPFSVSLTDATGNPVGSQNISISVIPDTYLKGFLVLRTLPEPSVWIYDFGSPTITCPNTDTNFNGIVDLGESSPLLPGNVVAASPATVTTDASGRAVFNLLYGEQFAPWLNVRVVARTTVAGTESSRTQIFSLSGSAQDFVGTSNPPAGVSSPFNGSNVNACP
jgi:hypothetical protein